MTNRAHIHEFYLRRLTTHPDTQKHTHADANTYSNTVHCTFLNLLYNDFFKNE